MRHDNDKVYNDIVVVIICTVTIFLRWRVSKKSLRARYAIIVKFVWQLYAQSDLRTQEVTEKVHLRDAVS